MPSGFPPELTVDEQKFCDLLGPRSRFYVFLREVRHLLFDKDMVDKLASMYGKTHGKERVRPEILVLALLLQRYCDVCDAEAVEMATADLRWRMVLGLPPGPSIPFSTKTLVFFRRRLLEHGLNAALVERLAILAERSALYDTSKIRGFAFDSAPTPLVQLSRDKKAMASIWHSARRLYEVALQVLGPHVRATVSVLDPPPVFLRSRTPNIKVDWTDQTARREMLDWVVRDAQRLRGLLKPQVLRRPRNDELRILFFELRALLKEHRQEGKRVGAAAP